MNAFDWSSSNQESQLTAVRQAAEASLEGLLDRLEVEPPERQVELERSWSAKNEECLQGRTDRRGFYTYYEVTKGGKAAVAQSLHKDFDLFTWARKKNDRECGGWPEFTRMLEKGESRCSYPWGINSFGHEFYRFGPDVFVHVKISHRSP